MKIFRLLFFFMLIQNIAYAQIPAPSLRCVKRDTLIWDIPTVACGAITNYQIWASRNLTGPYSVLTTIASTSQTRYFHNNIEGGTWYYYMTTTANCAGQTQRFSDTLDNDPPALNPVLVVSVLDNRTVDIRWRRNTSTKVVGYIVYKQTTSGLIPLDTVRSRDSVHYLDRRATPSVKVKNYQVLALDACGSTSLFDQNHNTIRLQAKQSKCDQTISLNWNLYRNWVNPIVRHDIWVSINGRSAYLLTSVGAKDTTYTVRNVPDRDRYNIVVRAVQSVTNTTSHSNDTTIVADIIQPVKILFMKNATVNDKGQVEIVWRWNLTAKVDSVRILRGTSDSSGYREIRRFKPIYPIDDEAFFLDSTARTSDSIYFYKVETKDDCGTRRISNYARTLLLRVNSLTASRQNRLAWDSYTFPLGTTLGYQPNRIINNATTPIGLPLDNTATQFLDAVSIDEPRVCYRIGANYKYSLPDGSSEEATSLSNMVCLDQFAKMWLPNAFTPNGKNPEFRPLLTFTDNIASYSMQIYDRWGGRIFQTSNTTQGWDGKRGSTDLPQGAYTFYIRLVQNNQEVVERTGVVMLIR
jgi:gliding motility-associated-like protein